MTQFARIEDDTIVELFSEEPVLHPTLMAQIEEVSDEFEIGMIRQVGDSFAIPAETTEQIQEALKAHRLDVEVGGFDLNGTRIESDEKSERRIIGAWSKAKVDATYQVNDWKSGDTFTTLTAPELIAIGDALDAHFQKCFTTERAVKSEIDNGTISTSADAIARFDEVFDES